jgi:hypothetical protein
MVKRNDLMQLPVGIGMLSFIIIFFARSALLFPCSQPLILCVIISARGFTSSAEFILNLYTLELPTEKYSSSRAEDLFLDPR